MAEYDYRGLEDFRSHIYQMDQYHYNDYSLQPRPCHNIAFMLEGRARFTENEKVIELKGHDTALSGLEIRTSNFIRCISIFPGKTILCEIENSAYRSWPDRIPIY